MKQKEWVFRVVDSAGSKDFGEQFVLMFRLSEFGVLRVYMG